MGNLLLKSFFIFILVVLSAPIFGSETEGVIYQSPSQTWYPSNANMSSSTSVLDSTITDDIRNTLTNDPTLSYDAKHIIVSVRDRNVTLYGEVESTKEKRQVLNLIHKVDKVRRVDDNLTIKK